MKLYMFYSELYQADFYWYGSLTVIVHANGEYQVFRDNYHDDKSNAACFEALSWGDSF